MIDAHQHFWRLARGDYGWLTPEQAVLYRDFEPTHLAPLMQAAGIGRSIVVQAAPSLEETHFLLALAEQTPWVAGVVGWVDLERPDAPEVLAEIAGDATLRGVRPMIQDIPDPGWMLDARLSPAFEQMVRSGLVFDALVRPVHLPNLRRLLDRHPDLRAVIDHGAKPDIAGGALEPWSRELAGLARDSAVFCKLSGLVTEAGDDVSLARIAPYAERLLAAFGPERVLWGSDWPVLNLACSYSDWCDMTASLVEPLEPADRAAVLGGNAERCYGLERRRG